jgi:alpha-aminoadipate/glutamate carrier protein LysW
MPTSVCPECTEEVFVDAECEQGDNVVCDECGSSLVVVGLDPIELDLDEEKAAGKAGADSDFDSYDMDDELY